MSDETIQVLKEIVEYLNRHANSCEDTAECSAVYAVAAAIETALNT